MRRRFRLRIPLFVAAVLAASLVSPTAGATIEPPWCGTPMPDAAANLPDGTQPGDPVGSFPHIPYYAIGCTLQSIQANSNGRMSVEVIGQSALGRDMYLVTINALDTNQQRKDSANWEKLRRDALSDPAKAQKFLARFGDEVKIPLFIQAGIHGNEYEGVDASMQVIEELATTPYGTDPAIDQILDHSTVLFNVIQNPDGRVAGTRANGNGFDLNRDFLTQSQSETLASVGIMQEWMAPDMLDLHGYATPTLIEATTKPHNPSIEYDMWLKWNQARVDANEAALNAEGYQIQRPINDWCSDADLPPCPPGETPGPAVAEGWDDWGPFYTPMYSQHIGLNGSTVEMCSSVSSCGGRAAAREIQEITVRSTLAYDVANRHDLLNDELEIYRRGVTDAARPACCPPPFDVDNNWMTEYPQAYLILLGQGQRSDAEANRLVRWLLFNGIEVDRVKRNYTFGSQAVPAGSYVVSMAQAHRGLADTALSIGVDVSSRINTLYAPPAAWSHGYLWGADVGTIPDGAPFHPQTKDISEPNSLGGGVEAGAADHFALEVDSATAVRTLNGLVGGGVSAQLAMASFATAGGATLPAGSAIFPADPATTSALNAAGAGNGLRFWRLTGALPAVDPVEGVPRIAQLTGGLTQEIWSLRNLGFVADPVSTATLNTAPSNPLDNYDVLFNTANWPTGASNATARSRLTAFFNAGGGYIGALSAGANFLSATNSGQLPGITPASSTGGGQSGIFNWTNSGGTASPIVGTFPAQDTLIMDPPTWFTAVPATAAVDARLAGDPASSFAAGLWRLPRPASANNAAVGIHGLSTDGVGQAARITVFAFNPLYRADPEREWPMVGAAAYWSDV